MEPLEPFVPPPLELPSTPTVFSSDEYAMELMEREPFGRSLSSSASQGQSRGSSVAASLDIEARAMSLALSEVSQRRFSGPSPPLHTPSECDLQRIRRASQPYLDTQDLSMRGLDFLLAQREHKHISSPDQMEEMDVSNPEELQFNLAMN